MPKKITPKKRQQIIDCWKDGMSYTKVAKATKVSLSTARKVVSEHKQQQEPIFDYPIKAQILKPCINPRIIMIYFEGDKSNFAKCVVKAGLNHPAGKPILVKKVETTNDQLYRAV
jgi:hypothetical protein